MSQTQTTGIFADRLSDLISKEFEQKKIGLKDLSEKIGVAAANLSKYQNDNAEASISNLAKIAQYFNVSTDYLLGLTNAATTDINIKSICDYTGLNEKAIKKLHAPTHRIFDYSQNFKDFVCMIICETKLADLISDYKKQLNYMFSIFKCNTNLCNKDSLLEDDIRKDYRLCYFDVIEELKTAVNKFTYKEYHLAEEIYNIIHEYSLSDFDFDFIPNFKNVVEEKEYIRNEIIKLYKNWIRLEEKRVALLLEDSYSKEKEIALSEYLKTLTFLLEDSKQVVDFYDKKDIKKLIERSKTYIILGLESTMDKFIQADLKNQKNSSNDLQDDLLF